MLAAAADFVCLADEVWRLQRGSDRDCVAFQRMVNGGERITDRGSRQGAWVLAPGGDVLARVNSRNRDKLLATLARGLAAWEALPPERRRLPDDLELTPDHRWEFGYPEDGLALERISRELPSVGPAGPRTRFWNRDHVWASADELAAWLPDGLAVGDVVALPALARRLARFHLVDDCRGQTEPFSDAQVELAELRASVTGADATGLQLELWGRTRAAADSSWDGGESIWKPRVARPHGMACELLGRAVWDPTRRRFADFDLVACGRRWGRTTFNGRGRDASPGLVGFHFGPTRDDRRLPPTFVAVYDVDWIPHPAVPTWRESPAECGLETDG